MSEIEDAKRMIEKIQPIAFPDYASISREMTNIKKTDAGYASVLFKKLIKQVRLFEEGLTDEEELGSYLASFGTSVLIRVDEISYEDPFFITFTGTVEGAEEGQVRLVQHCSQLNFLFKAVKKSEERDEPRRIGFDSIVEEDH